MKTDTPDDIEVVVPNLHWHYTGVTATNRMLAPRLAARLRAVWLGRDRPEGIAALPISGLFGLWGPGRRRVVWHARRNNEMIAGLLLRALGWPLRLVFTSAAQRRHTRLTRWLIARMDAVIATSAFSAAYLERDAVIIHHGVDTERYAPPADRVAAFAASGLPGRYGIGAFGRVRPQKGTDVFVAAMCRLLPAYPDFTAVVIGATAPEHRGFLADLQAQAAAAGVARRIAFLGELPIEEVPGWYARTTIYCFTSRNEGFGLTLIEAMAAGTALVAARAGAAEAVVTPETGVLVPTGDVDALVAALEPLMRNPEAAIRMGEQARRHAVEALSIDAEADRYVAVYRSLDGANRPTKRNGSAEALPS